MYDGGFLTPVAAGQCSCVPVRVLPNNPPLMEPLLMSCRLPGSMDPSMSIGLGA